MNRNKDLNAVQTCFLTHCELEEASASHDPTKDTWVDGWMDGCHTWLPFADIIEGVMAKSVASFE